MGLDSVELVMKVEDRYRIRLPDAECSQVRTVADLAALIISQLPRANAPCPAAHSFFNVRKTVVQQWGIARRTLRPDTPLEMVFPRETRRSRWNLLAKTQPHLPHLVLKDNASRRFTTIGRILLLLWIVASVALLLEFGASGALASAFVLIATATLFLWARAQWTTDFPTDCATLGDLARTISASSLPENGSERLLAEHQILDQVQIMTAEQLGIEREKVTPESRFVEDLGLA